MLFFALITWLYFGGPWYFTRKLLKTAQKLLELQDTMCNYYIPYLFTTRFLLLVSIC